MDYYLHKTFCDVCYTTSLLFTPPIGEVKRNERNEWGRDWAFLRNELIIMLSLFQHYWWLVISLLGGLLVFLLFVQGANSLILFQGKTEIERQLIIYSTGRKWEFNFTTLATFCGAFFASFPCFIAPVSEAHMECGRSSFTSLWCRLLVMNSNPCWHLSWKANLPLLACHYRMAFAIAPCHSSTIHTNSSLSIANSSASETTLFIMTIVFAIIPFVFVCIVYAWR